MKRWRPSISSLARFCACHPWLVVAVWLVLLGGALFAARGIDERLTGQDMDFLGSPESVQGRDLLAQALPGRDAATETVIVRSETATVEEAAFKEQVTALTDDLAALPAVAGAPHTYYQVAMLAPQAAEALISADRHATIIPVTLAESGEPGEQVAQIEEVLARHRGDGFQVLTIGDASIQEEFVSTAMRDLRTAEMIGLPLTLGILVLVFGSVAAAAVSLSLGLVAIGVTLGITALLGRFFPLSFFVLNMIVMIGLAVGVDYALFIISRFREERRLGAPKLHAIENAAGTASKAVLFSGVTVLLALLGLFIVPITTFRSLGTGAVVVVAVAVLAMLTLVPALLSLLGDRIDWPRRRRVQPLPTAAPASPAAHAGPKPEVDDTYHGFWGRVAKVVMRRPIIGIVVGIVILVGLAVPALGLEKTASGGAESLPPGPVRDAYTILARDFSPGLLAPVEIVVAGERTPEAEEAVQRLTATLASDPDFTALAQVTWSADGRVALISAPLNVDPDSATAYDAIGRLRTDTVPAALAGAGSSAYVAGHTAEAVDLVQVVDRYTPFVFLFVLGLSFVLLLVVFRSLAVPLKALLMNLLSVGAAYGLLVVVFQKGVGQKLFGFVHTPSLEAWIPLFLFCVLFGLSMDYHVFLLSRIREHYDHSQDNARSVAQGLKTTGRLITGAALIMVAVFATFAAGNLVMLQQAGFGLAVAVALDATLVRSVLVPSTMAVLGRLNWFLPRWLHWLPRLRLEGKAGRHRAPSSSP